VVLLGGLWLVPSPGAAALPILGHHGRWLTDRQGRVVILHGVQIDKFMPTQQVEGWIDLSPANVRFIGAEGFNAARVSMAFAGVEPQLGQYDDSYVARYLAFDRELAQARVYDLIDMMQGEYSTVVGGWGFTAWMTITNGAANNHEPFAGGYLTNPAENAAWDNLWSNTPAGDGVGLQDHYARGLHRLAQAFAGAPALLGWEILNEPWPGSRWPACFSSAGCPPSGFDQTSLTSFYRRVIPVLRGADRRHLIAYEPSLLFDFGNPTRLGALADPNLLFAFHNYCLASAPGLPPNPALSASCATSENTTLNNAGNRARETGDALLMDEWGNSTNLSLVNRVAQEADQHLVGWTVWAYERQFDATSRTDPAHLRSREHTNWRERQQATNLVRLIEAAPGEPMLVWCGNGHASKHEPSGCDDAECIPMGWNFRVLSRIDPFVFDQTVTVAFSGRPHEWRQQLVDSLADTLAGLGGTAGILQAQAPPPLDRYTNVDALVVSTDNALTGEEPTEDET